MSGPNVVRDDLAGEVRRLKELPGKEIAVIGSASIVQQLANHGLIDEYRLLVHPVVLGAGKPLWTDIGDRQRLRLVKSEAFSNGVLSLRYQRAVAEPSPALGPPGVGRGTPRAMRRSRPRHIEGVVSPMSDEFFFVLTLLAALGCGLNGGVFLAFSTFVMRALARLPPAHGIAAMQSINVVAVTPPFMAVFLGTALACVALAVASLLMWGEPGAVYLLLGSLLYLVGTVLVTIAFNVPRNDALAAITADSADGATQWARFVPGWTAWNTVRTVATLAAATALTLALVVG